MQTHGDSNGAGAGVRDGLQEGGPVSDLDSVEKGASRQCAWLQAEHGLAIRTDRRHRARPVATEDEATHVLGQAIVALGPDLLLLAAQGAEADNTGSNDYGEYRRW